jgi:Beta-lactamase enzyme family
MRVAVVAMTSVALVAAAAPGSEAAACTATLNPHWRPDMRAALLYAFTRQGDISFAVRTEHHFYAYRPDHVVPSASVLKAMLLVAYLDLPWVRSRSLTDSDRALLVPMITASDNVAATEVRNIVGDWRLVALARRVGMRNFATNPIWGLSQITARDQTLFFLHLERYVAFRHRRFALLQLASIIPSQRWGIGRVALHGWKVYFKGGWGSGTGAVDHQVALLVHGCQRVAVAIMTLGDGSHAYGKDTLFGIASRLLRGLPRYGR